MVTGFVLLARPEVRFEMRKIVDSNYLQAPALRDYLAKSTANFAVLTDYASTEAYKGKTLTSIYRSMEILSQYPKQVIVLRGTQTVCGLKGRRSGLLRRMIDDDQTRGFARAALGFRRGRQKRQGGANSQ